MSLLRAFGAHGLTQAAPDLRKHRSEPHEQLQTYENTAQSRTSALPASQSRTSALPAFPRLTKDFSEPNEHISSPPKTNKTLLRAT